VDQPEGNLITFKKLLHHEGRTSPALTPDLLIKDRQPTQQLLPGGKKTSSGTVKTLQSPQKAEREQTSAASPPNKKSSKPLSAAGAKPKLQKTGKPPSSSSATASSQPSHRAPTTIAELHTVSGIGPEKADRYGACHHRHLPPMLRRTYSHS